MNYEAERGDFTMVALGDAMLSRRFAVFKEERFLRMVELMRGADCTFANLEMLFHEYAAPADPSTPTPTQSDPSNLEELKWAGINLVSFSNNHSYDFGQEGLLTTIQHLKRHGIPYSGAGRNLQEARMPGYLDTRRGRVALISVTSTFSPHWRAGEQRPDMQGRPGANCLDFKTTYSVDRQALEELKRISARIGWEDAKERQNTQGYYGRIYDDTDSRFHFFDKVFELGEEWRVNTTCNPRDLEGNLKWVRAAARQADWVLVSLHSHEMGETPDLPADFAREFAHACIDAGAHALIGHGPHFLRGMEVYKGHPIFYSLGNFIFQLETLRRFPQESYDLLDLGYQATPTDYMWARYAGEKRSFPADSRFWHSVMAAIQWEDWKLKEVRLYPLDLGHGRAWGQRGRPMLADPKVGREILERFQELSRPFESEVEIEDNVGIVRP